MNITKTTHKNEGIKRTSNRAQQKTQIKEEAIDLNVPQKEVTKKIWKIFPSPVTINYNFF